MRFCFLPLSLLFCLVSCDQKPPPLEKQPPEVKVQTIQLQDVPIEFTFVGQAESSRQVEIRARVSGFLDKVAYNEGDKVEAGEILFVMDKKPFIARLQQEQGILALQQARAVTALANLKRIRPLAKKDAVSQKTLDDAEGAAKEAEAAVLSAEGAVDEAKLNLSYTTIRTPVTGLASKTAQQEGSYLTSGPSGLLTYVAQLDPIWVNFSISENQILYVRQQSKEGKLIQPPDASYIVKAQLGDGTVHPYPGRISFAEPNLDPSTGTFMLRAELPNPGGHMRPGQFVRVHLYGAKRPNAILVPQTAVQQGSKGHFVWIIDKENRAKVQEVQVGSWHGHGWFIAEGLRVGDRVVVDGLSRLSQNVPVRIVDEEPKQKQSE